MNDMSPAPVTKRPILSSPSRRTAILLAVVLGSFSLAFLLPKQSASRPCALKMQLPETISFRIDSARYIGEQEFQEWKGIPMPVSPEERRLLADDTQFEKKNYFCLDVSGERSQVLPFHSVQVSIVLSGHDLNDSIHRPERCLPSQGYKGLEVTRRVLRTAYGDIPISRIRCYHELLDSETGKFRVGPDGKPVRVEQIFYYWFVGNHDLTSSHYERTFLDMKDRLVGGFDQHWAYILLGSTISEPLVANGLLPGDPVYPLGRSEAQTDALLEQITQAIAKDVILWSQLEKS